MKIVLFKAKWPRFSSQGYPWDYSRQPRASRIFRTSWIGRPKYIQVFQFSRYSTTNSLSTTNRNFSMPSHPRAYGIRRPRRFASSAPPLTPYGRNRSCRPCLPHKVLLAALRSTLTAGPEGWVCRRAETLTLWNSAAAAGPGRPRPRRWKFSAFTRYSGFHDTLAAAFSPGVSRRFKPLRRLACGWSRWFCTAFPVYRLPSFFRI